MRSGGPFDDPQVQQALAVQDELARTDRPIAGWDSQSRTGAGESVTVADNSGKPIAVLDTSVVVKWFLHEGEAHRSEASALRDAIGDGRVGLAVPALLLYEVANVLRYKPDWDADRVQRAIRSLVTMQLDIEPVSFQCLE